MPSLCVVASCPNRSVKEKRASVKMHRFPASEKYRVLWEKWTSMIDERHFKSHKFACLCSDHFDPKYYTTHGRLMNFAVPSLWLGSEIRLEESVFTFNCVPGSNIVYEQTKPVCNCPCFCGARNSSPQLPEKNNIMSDSGAHPERPRTPPSPPWNCDVKTLKEEFVPVQSVNFEESISDPLSIEPMEPTNTTAVSGSESIAGSSLTTESIPEQIKKSRRGRESYFGDLTPSSFSTPRRRDINVKKFKALFAETRKKLWSQNALTKKLRAKIQTMNDVINLLKLENKLLNNVANVKNVKV